MTADLRTKVMLAVLGLLVLFAAYWYGKDLLPTGDAPPASAPATTPGQASAPPSPEQAKATLVGEALEATGMNRALEQISQQMMEGGDASGSADQVPPEVAAKLRQAMRESFPAEPMRERLRQRLLTDYNEAYLRALLDDVKKPEIQSLIAMESAHAPSRETLLAFAEEQRQAPPPPARAELLKRLEAAVGATRQASEIVMTTARAMMQGVANASGRPAPALEDKMAQLRATLEPTLRENLLLSMAYTYRQAKDENLSAYTAMYESPHGRWFTDNVFLALRDEFKFDAENFGARVAQLTQEAGGKSATQSPSQAASAPVAALPEQPAAQATAQPAAQAEAGEAAGPAPAPTVRTHRRWHKDARECLKKGDDRAVIRCAERYY